MSCYVLFYHMNDLCIDIWKKLLASESSSSARLFNGESPLQVFSDQMTNTDSSGSEIQPVASGEKKEEIKEGRGGSNGAGKGKGEKKRGGKKKK